MVPVELRIDPSLAEEVVFRSARSPDAGDVAAAYDAQRTALYSAPMTSDARNAAFEQLALRAFEGLGFADVFRQRLGEFPQLDATADLVLVQRAWTRKEERVELFVRERPAPLTSILIAVQAQRVLERARLIEFLRRELLHVADMCDPAFAYSPTPELGGSSPTENDVIRDRFRLLWDAFVEARMRRWGWLPTDSQEQVAAPHTRLAEVSRRHTWTQSALLALAQYDTHHSQDLRLHTCCS